MIIEKVHLDDLDVYLDTLEIQIFLVIISTETCKEV